MDVPLRRLPEPCEERAASPVPRVVAGEAGDDTDADASPADLPASVLREPGDGLHGPRTYAEEVSRRAGPALPREVVRVGRTVLVATAAAELALRSVALDHGDPALGPDEISDEDGAGEQPATVDAVLAIVGMHRRTGR